jgi:hypothetical protein
VRLKELESLGGKLVKAFEAAERDWIKIIFLGLPPHQHGDVVIGVTVLAGTAANDGKVRKLGKVDLGPDERVLLAETEVAPHGHLPLAEWWGKDPLEIGRADEVSAFVENGAAQRMEGRACSPSAKGIQVVMKYIPIVGSPFRWSRSSGSAASVIDDH